MKVALGFGHWAISRWEAIVSLALKQSIAVSSLCQMRNIQLSKRITKSTLTMIELGFELLGDFDRPSHLKWCSDDCIRQSYGDNSHKTRDD